MKRILLAATVALSPSLALAQSSSGTVKIPDGNDVALGKKTDEVYAGGAGSVISILKGMFQQAVPLGAAGSPSNSVMTVQGVTSMTPLLVGQALDADIGAVTSAPVIQGYVVSGTPVYTNGKVNALTMKTDGSLRVNITDGFVTAIGSVSDAKYNWAGEGDGTLVSLMKGMGDLALNVGTAGSPASDVVSVQGISGGVGIKVGDTPNTPTGSIYGPLVQGVVTTNPPVGYTNNTINALSLDESGNLRVAASLGGISQGAASSGVAGTMVQGVATTSAPTYGNNTINPLSSDAQGNLRVASAGGDVCQRRPHTFTPISTVAATTQLVAGTTSKRTYICGLMLIANAAETISVVSGTGSSCTTPTAMIGNATIADGIAIAANQGFAIGSGGYAMAESTSGGTICLTKAAGVVRVSGSIVTAVEP